MKIDKALPWTTLNNWQLPTALTKIKSTQWNTEGSVQKNLSWFFRPDEPLAAMPGVEEGGAACCVPTWVQRGKHNSVLKKIERAFCKC